ncbi:hypothetical protein BDV96DRAFT_644849 [Lophiotrema nucula]|uniref:Heterokaryon incompatibility domain-containing protein n=1 Tax=Lophiotrema nucula TaxID=690887 RepID=A0A6A5ZGC3_9PLEO|nr:hypothetical protein BDV96DRAFT_644849 [Lophiotrema nucula]
MTNVTRLFEATVPHDSLLWVTGFYVSSNQQLLWTARFPALLWCVDKPPTRRPEHSEYRCPSWSWAATDAIITTKANKDWTDLPDRCLNLLDVVNINLSLMDTTYLYGRLLAAKLTVRGRLEPVTWVLHRGFMDEKLPGMERLAVTGPHIGEVFAWDVCFDSVADARVDQFANLTYLLPICVGRDDVTGVRKSYILGILIREHPNGDKDNFERVGRMYLSNDGLILDELLDIEEKEIILV